jgi:hypothetical protein
MVFRRFPILVFAVLMAGCNVFNTQDFIPAQPRTVSLSLLPTQSDTLEYTYSEYLTYHLESERDTLIGQGEMRLIFVGEDTLQKCSRIRRSTLGTGMLGGRVDTVCLDKGDGGLVLTGFISAGGGFLPRGKGEDSGAMGQWKLLPPGLEIGNHWYWVAGEVEVSRTLNGIDTLVTGASLSQAWTVAESITRSGSLLSQAQYWFAASGLVQAEWTYPAFRQISSLASDEGLTHFRVVIRRSN